MDTKEMCNTMISNALALLTMSVPMCDREKNIGRLIKTYFSEFSGLTVNNFDNKHIEPMMRSVAHMILEETSKMDKDILRRLENVCQNAVEYVGFANYRERERWALMEVSRCFTEAESREPRLSEIEFREDNRN